MYIRRRCLRGGLVLAVTVAASQCANESPDGDGCANSACAAQLYERAKEHDLDDEYTEAFKWYRRSAKAGHTQAQLDLASRYEDGRGVAQHYSNPHYS